MTFWAVPAELQVDRLLREEAQGLETQISPGAPEIPPLKGGIVLPSSEITGRHCTLPWRSQESVSGLHLIYRACVQILFVHMVSQGCLLSFADGLS